MLQNMEQSLMVEMQLWFLTSVLSRHKNIGAKCLKAIILKKTRVPNLEEGPIRSVWDSVGSNPFELRTHSNPGSSTKNELQTHSNPSKKPELLTCSARNRPKLGPNPENPNFEPRFIYLKWTTNPPRTLQKSRNSNWVRPNTSLRVREQSI